MNVRITVSTTKTEGSIGKAQSITLSDVSTLAEVNEAVNREFKTLFPTYQTLDKTPEKKKKGE